ncbi:M48 family metallopeptidase [Pseudomonadales bacterium]|nr:M48 family metallopeptidase [Pseudomonadales bacterium]
MNFFEQQDRARKRTGLLVLLFSLAVLCLVLASCVLVALFFALTQSSSIGSRGAAGLPSYDSQSLLYSLQMLPFETVGGIFLVVLSVVLLGSTYKLSQLSAGGSVVADAMGGRLINMNSRNASEKTLLNIVEEMAIASGTPVPPVYVLDEAAINAFAAGTTPQNAAIGVTQGAIEQLDRSELQGVIAHEFSHIFNGDMRLNMRLIGILYGILVIGGVGYYMLRVASRGAMMRGRSGSKNSAVPFMALGGGLMVIGYAGTFFGNLIKSAVSRQREFLADASAVQFTRDPGGIGNALKKIGGFSEGSKIIHPEAHEASHMFFGQAVSFFWNGLFATHPPLAERIARIDRGWVAPVAAEMEGNRPVGDQNIDGRTAGFAGSHALYSQPIEGALLTESIANVGGEITLAQQAFARELLATLPTPVVDAAHESYGARALVYCLLLDSCEIIRTKQLSIISSHCDALTANMVRALQHELTDKGVFLDVLDLALPVLKQLSPRQLRAFDEVIIELIHADNKIELLEWSLYNIVRINLWPVKSTARAFNQVSNIKMLGRSLGTILSVVSYAGVYENIFENTTIKNQNSELAVSACFDAAAKKLGLMHLRLVNRQAITLDTFTQALALLNTLRPLQKPRVLKALATAVTHDNVVQPLELQLLRAIALSLDCPMPRLMHGA